MERIQLRKNGTIMTSLKHTVTALPGLYLLGQGLEGFDPLQEVADPPLSGEKRLWGIVLILLS